MNFKKFVIAGTIGCAAISFSLIFAACGDDKSSSANEGDETAEEFMFTLEELEEMGVPIFESANELEKKTCGNENEFETVYVKADSSFYVCYEGEWDNDFSSDNYTVEIPIVESKDDLGECSDENDGEMFRVPRDTIFDTYACENGEWVSDFGGNSGEPVDPTTVVKGTFTDERDGKTYKTVKIGDQTWMAENLNYKSDGSSCYDNDDSYCEQYGRLYPSEEIKTIYVCPDGWRLPNSIEWMTLYKNMGNNLYIGLTDPYEFNMSLGGYRDGVRYHNMGLSVGYWARATGALISIRTVNTRQKNRKRDRPWIHAAVVNSNDAMYMRCIKK